MKKAEKAIFAVHFDEMAQQSCPEIRIGIPFSGFDFQGVSGEKFIEVLCRVAVIWLKLIGWLHIVGHAWQTGVVQDEVQAGDAVFEQIRG